MRKIVVVGNTHAEAETWARKNLAHPYVVASSRAHRHLAGLHILTVIFTPKVRTVSHQLWEQLRRCKAISGVNESIMVD